MKDLDFKYRFIPSSSQQKHGIDNYDKANGSRNNNQLDTLTLLLLHGTGGNEDDLIQVGRMISSTASLLSPRGKVLENGMPRFFRRLAEGVFDIDDLKIRTKELADFVKEASNIYSFNLSKTIAVGFSNGANIAASLLLSYPETLMGAILFRAMVPYIPNSQTNLTNKNVLLSAGVFDPIVSKNQTQNLFDLFIKSGARVTLKWQQSGHNLTESDILYSKEWLSENFK
jgi:predicted esterase